MNLRKQLATKNECYIRGDKMKPTGIVVHSKLRRTLCNFK